MPDKRGRNWTFLVYLDSAPVNWISILSDDLRIPFAISPLHDCDLNEDGSPKKPHYHVALSFEGNKSFSQIQEIASAVNGTLVFQIESMQGMIQYFIHKNNPEKHQYKKEDIRSFCGFEIDPYFAPSSAALERMCNDIDEFIIDNDITEFDDLIQKARLISKEWVYILRNRNTQFYKAWLHNRAMIAKSRPGRDEIIERAVQARLQELKSSEGEGRAE